MTKNQENRYSMYLVLQDFVEKNPTKVNALPRFMEFWTSFAYCITEIQTQRAVQEASKKGFAKEKDKFKGQLVVQAASILKKLKAYAMVEENSVLESELKYTESELKRSADTILHDRCQLILERAKDHLPNLAAYQITQTMLDALAEAIAKYKQAIPNPRTGTVDRKAATTSLATCFDTADNLLRNKIDKLIDILHESDTAFYSKYLELRSIVNTSGRKKKKEEEGA